MDVIKAARELGKALQADERYIRYAKAMLASEKNEELQAKIGEFNLTRMNLDKELGKDEGKNDETVKELNTKLRTLYDEVMSEPTMVEFNEARAEVDKILNDVNSIITMSAQGADPETCDLSACTGDCSSCGGCH
ncbi:MAG: YlbF family regulator [Clostridiales bacterium]|nr:YlbF family regulator [Candidatus Equinaster intestinalis]